LGNPISEVGKSEK